MLLNGSEFDIVDLNLALAHVGVVIQTLPSQSITCISFDITVGAAAVRTGVVATTLERLIWHDAVSVLAVFKELKTLNVRIGKMSRQWGEHLLDAERDRTSAHLKGQFRVLERQGVEVIIRWGT